MPGTEPGDAGHRVPPATTAAGLSTQPVFDARRASRQQDARAVFRLGNRIAWFLSTRLIQAVLFLGYGVGCAVMIATTLLPGSNLGPLALPILVPFVAVPALYFRLLRYRHAAHPSVRQVTRATSGIVLFVCGCVPIFGMVKLLAAIGRMGQGHTGATADVVFSGVSSTLTRAFTVNLVGTVLLLGAWGIAASMQRSSGSGSGFS